MTSYQPFFLEFFFLPIKPFYIITLLQTNFGVWFMDAMTYGIAALLIYHGSKKHGLWQMMLFFTGSFVYTGLEENFMIVAGALLPTQNTYQFNYAGYTLWFMAVPVVVCVAWFVIAYSSYEIMDFIFSDLEGNKGLIVKAILCGLLAMVMDLMIDPLQTRIQNWYWLNEPGEALCVLGIPISNFIGWWILISCFAIFWPKVCGLEEKIGKTKTIILFYPLLLGFEILTVILVAGSSILLTALPIWGMNFTIGGI
ncbi:MAG: carotenoid biosynthesis protein [Candidatus Helarchaeales archaeon]